MALDSSLYSSLSMPARFLISVKLDLCQVNAASGDIAFAEIFAGEHEVRIDRQRLAIIGDADFKTAGLAVAVARVIQHAGIILVLNCGQNLQSPLILTRFGQHAALLIKFLIRENTGFNFHACIDVIDFLDDFAFLAFLHGLS